MIWTIRDLDKYSEAEIEGIRRQISFKKIAIAQMKQNGQQEGMTSEEYKKWRQERQPIECPRCHGRGNILPSKRTVGTIHASSAHACTLALYYDITGELRPRDYIKPELQITFAIGHAVHDLVQGALRDALGPIFEDEVKVDLWEAWVTGSSTDGLVDPRKGDLPEDSAWKRHGWPAARCVLEIKTMSDAQFIKLKEPLDYHILQAMGIYAQGLNVPFVSFLYVSKSWPHSMKEYVYAYDPKVFRRWWLKKGKKIEEALDNKKPPAATATKYDCTNCKYQHECPQALGVRDRFVS